MRKYYDRNSASISFRTSNFAIHTSPVSPGFSTIRPTPLKRVRILYSQNSAKNTTAIRPVTCHFGSHVRVLERKSSECPGRLLGDLRNQNYRSEWSTRQWAVSPFGSLRNCSIPKTKSKNLNGPGKAISTGQSVSLDKHMRNGKLSIACKLEKLWSTEYTWIGNEKIPLGRLTNKLVEASPPSETDTTINRIDSA